MNNTAIYLQIMHNDPDAKFYIKKIKDYCSSNKLNIKDENIKIIKHVQYSNGGRSRPFTKSESDQITKLMKHYKECKIKQIITFKLSNLHTKQAGLFHILKEADFNKINILTINDNFNTKDIKNLSTFINLLIGFSTEYRTLVINKTIDRLHKEGTSWGIQPKLTTDEINKIKELSKKGLSYRKIHKILNFKCSPHTIHRVIAGKGIYYKSLKE